MSVAWQIEYPGLQLNPHDAHVTWTMKNTGDESALEHSQCGEITIWRHHEDSNPSMDSSPRVEPLMIDREVQPDTAHTMVVPVWWEGQQPGMYTASVTLGEASGEIYFQSGGTYVTHPY
jgi:hypothetical protein